MVQSVPLVMRLLVSLLVVLLAACAEAAPVSEPTPSATPTPTATPTATPSPTPTPVTYWPLRGTVAPDAAAIGKRPVLVRMPDDTSARPQTGLAKADMVWELLTEGGITRYMAVFHSEEVDQLGPIRSARLSDLHYAPMLRGILAHVGASHVVLERVRAAAAQGQFVDADEFLYGSYYTRVTFRAAPQNVYTSTARIRAAAKVAGDAGNVTVPALEFANGAKDTGAVSETASSRFSIPYQGAMDESYAWDANADGWTRVQGGVTTTDAATGKPIVTQNVVAIFTDITPQPGIVEDSLGSLSLDIRSTGTGRVSVFTGGHRFDGTWSRQGTDMYRFKDASGAPILLAPGQTWVHVVPADWSVTSAP